ncbi:MAG: MarR family winged helix-turn-helix transcriptional regulator, partial [Acidimicrobiales bacterium]
VGGLVENLVAGVARRRGLTHAALNALAVIEGNAGPIPAGEMGARMHITSGSVTSLIDGLERLGFVTRLSDPDDRRRVLIDVTPNAQAVLDLVLPEVQQVCVALVDGMSNTRQRSLLSALTGLRSAIAEVPAELSPPKARRRPRGLGR